MKVHFAFIFMLFSMLLFGCSDSGEEINTTNSGGTGTNSGNQNNGLYYDHKVEIKSPNNLNKTIDTKMEIEVEFSSQTNRTVHYIQIRIYNKSDDTESYNMPSNTHLDDDSGFYVFKDELNLGTDIGFSSGTTWVFEAKVWGPGSDNEEILKTLEFSIN